MSWLFLVTQGILGKKHSFSGNFGLYRRPRGMETQFQNKQCNLRVKYLHSKIRQNPTPYDLCLSLDFSSNSNKESVDD